ncbi:MAG TPA: DUF1127 domain-containing protein [Bradyrhizobium sp.]|nr:DUF1127 domain-containing protein [Bradyrhizobium sp.]
MIGSLKMTRLMDLELTMDRRATMPASVASVDGLARIAAFGRSLANRWRHVARKHQVMQEFAALNERMLSDIGLDRGDTERVAELTAQAYAPVDGTLFHEIESFLRDLLVRPLVRFARRRRAYQNLMALDDRMLNDIGLTRDEIPAVVKSLTGEAPAWNGDAEEGSTIRVWNRYRATAKELGQLDNHMLADIGIVRGDIDWVAEELAIRSVRPAANANSSSAPRAA